MVAGWIGRCGGRCRVELCSVSVLYLEAIECFCFYHLARGRAAPMCSIPTLHGGRPAWRCTGRRCMSYALSPFFT